MTILSDTIKCDKCGCIALPDAIRCPKCGALYNRNGSSNFVADAIGSYPVQPVNGGEVKIVRAQYQLTCHNHGTIQVKSSVIGQSMKCPFCE